MRRFEYVLSTRGNAFPHAYPSKRHRESPTGRFRAQYEWNDERRALSCVGSKVACRKSLRKTSLQHLLQEAYGHLTGWNLTDWNIAHQLHLELEYDSPFLTKRKCHLKHESTKRVYKKETNIYWDTNYGSRRLFDDVRWMRSKGQEDLTVSENVERSYPPTLNHADIEVEV